LRSLTSRPVTGIPNGPRPPPGWFPEPEDARPSTPGSNPGRAGRPPTIRGGNGSHTSHPGLLTRTAASVRSESPRNRIAPGPTRLVSVPSRGAPHHLAVHRGASAGPDDGAFRLAEPGACAPLPLTGAGPPPREAGPLGVRSHTGQPSVEWRRSPSQDLKRGKPPLGPSIDTPNTCRRRQRWDRLASQAERSTPGRWPGRSLASPPTKSGDFPRSFFGWSSPRGVAPAPRIRPKPGRGAEPFAGGY